jgi:CheY-like chemotaxis protein
MAISSPLARPYAMISAADHPVRMGFSMTPTWAPASRLGADAEAAPGKPVPALRVLIVEDEAIIAMEMEAILQGGGHLVVDAVATAEEAIAVTRRTQPDLVLMDIRLARGGDGIAAALVIRNELGIGSIFLTAHSDQPTRLRAAAAAPLGFIVKPISPERLLQAVLASCRH